MAEAGKLTRPAHATPAQWSFQHCFFKGFGHVVAGMKRAASGAPGKIPQARIRSKPTPGKRDGDAAFGAGGSSLDERWRRS
jgi:hypothetical protein